MNTNRILDFTVIMVHSEGLPEWKKYDTEEAVILELGLKPETGPGLYKSELTFLSSQ